MKHQHIFFSLYTLCYALTFFTQFVFAATLATESITLTDRYLALQQAHASEIQKTSKDKIQVHIAFLYLDRVTENLTVSEIKQALLDRVYQTNLVWSNSGLNAELEISHIAPWPEVDQLYLEQSTARQAYENMRPLIDQWWAQGLFQTWNADILFLVDYRTEDFYCGWATIDTEAGLRSHEGTNSYGILRLGPGCGLNAVTLPHEIGHLLGAAHGQEEAATATHPLGYGAHCGDKFTIMHTHFDKHFFYSSPEKFSDNHEACGDAHGADNTSLFKERLPLLANKVNPEITASEPRLLSTERLQEEKSGGSLEYFYMLIVLLCFRRTRQLCLNI